MATPEPLICIACKASPCRCVHRIKFADGKGSKGKWARRIIVTKAHDHDGGYHFQMDGKRVRFNYHSSAVIRVLAQLLTDESPHLGSIKVIFTSTKKPK